MTIAGTAAWFAGALREPDEEGEDETERDERAEASGELDPRRVVTDLQVRSSSLKISLSSISRLNHLLRVRFTGVALPLLVLASRREDGPASAEPSDGLV